MRQMFDFNMFVYFPETTRGIVYDLIPTLVFNFCTLIFGKQIL